MKKEWALDVNGFENGKIPDAGVRRRGKVCSCQELRLPNFFSYFGNNIKQNFFLIRWEFCHLVDVFLP